MKHYCTDRFSRLYLLGLWRITLANFNGSG